MNKTKENINKILVLITWIVFFIFPTSFNGTRYTIMQEIISWTVLSVVIVLFLMFNKINFKSTIIGLIMIIYMFIVTVIANTNIEFEISIARIAPIICVTALFCIKMKNEISFKYFEFILNVMCIILIIWNLATLLNITAMINFVVQNYTQFYDYATKWQLTIGKPVFTFGVHNVAAFFYIQIFLLCYFSYSKKRNIIYIVYMLAILIFTLLLKSTTSLGFSLIMVGIFYFIIMKNVVYKYIYLFIYIFIIFIAIGVFLNSSLFDSYMSMLFSQHNGFIPRYLGENTIFANNIEILKNNILGIGFTIPRGDQQAYFADSGYMVYLTMGSVIFPIVLYYLFFKYVSSNVPKECRKFFILTVILFELSMPSFMYIRSIYFYLFTAAFYKSLASVKSETKKLEESQKTKMT